MFEMTYLGHAGWLIKNGDFKCAFDPWSASAGSFFNQWSPFPDNSEVNFLESLQGLDFLYISHAHEDHFNKSTLSSVSRDVPIFIPKFRDKTLFSSVKQLGFRNITQLDPNEQVNIKGVVVKIVRDEGYLDNDSCILLDDGTNKILNLNDCHIDFTKLKDITGNVDVLLLQSSSALWWPCVYNYDDVTMRTHGANKRRNILKRSLQYAQTLNARLTIPNAGPPIFKNASLDVWNYNRRESWNPFSLADDNCSFLRKEGLDSEFMMPAEKLIVSDVLELDKNDFLREEVYGDVDKYTRSYLNRLRSNEDCGETYIHSERVNAALKFKEQIQKIATISRFYTSKINFPFLFSIENVCDYVIDFEKEDVITELVGESHQCSYLFEIDPDSLVEIMAEKSVDFESYFLGCNFKCSRNPDVYNEFLFALLRHFDTKRFLISEELYGQSCKALDELFVLQHQGETYEVQKYCPHMFANLEEVGYMDGSGNFICPLHGWKFNVDTGECVNKKNYCLKIRKVEK